VIEPPPRRSTRNRTIPRNYWETDRSPTRGRSKDTSTALYAFLTYEEAIRNEDQQEWRSAMIEEIEMLKKYETWELVDLPPGRKRIGCKWHLVRKKNADGSDGKYKARLVAKGYTQIEGIDFNETFAPVARFNSIRTTLAIAVQLDLKIKQIDIRSAYLNGVMTEEIYMEQPKGYDDNSGRVCLLKKGLYGTKQGGRIWNENLHQTLTESGLKRIQADDCIYVHGNPNQLTEYMILVVYVDDILIMRHQDGESFANRIVEKINSKYEVKDMGEVDFYLGAKIHRNAQGIMIEQSGFANEVLKRFGMEDCKEIATPMEERLELKSWSEGDELTDKPYRSLVGSLMYLYLVSRPDIGYSICTLSKFLEKPTKEHWNYALRILRYIKAVSYTHLTLPTM
jgi:hypothetical protein